jgi:RNA polymerase sigma-70 factor (ECF subfamily)
MNTPSQRSKSLEAPDERLMLQAMRRGDPAAEAWLVEQHRERLYRAAVHFLGWQDPDAEDVVQETFLQALKGLDGFRGDSKLYTWLNQICARNCFKRLRQRRRLLLGAESDLAAALVLPAPEPDALHRLLDGERRGQIQAALAVLSQRCREIVERRDLLGQAYAVAAAGLKLPLGTFMSRLSRCRESLRQKIEEMNRRER